MSDALCGPSNPLQQFKQQTQFDRTLQQDRLTSRHTPAQGFRSANPNAGLLDPEFEAFQAGLPAPDLPQYQLSHQSPPTFAGPSQAPSWATDFQRMQISPPPTFQRQHVPLPDAASSNWAQGFREHIAQAAPRAPSSAQSPQSFQHMARYGTSGFQSQFAQPSFAQPVVQSKGKDIAVEQFDDAAFERAFDLAKEDMMADSAVAHGLDVAGQAPYEQDTSIGNYEDHVDAVRREAMAAIQGHQRRLSQELEAQQLRIHPESLQKLESDIIAEDAIMEQEDSQQTQDQQQRLDDDALAATAQELLEKVEHNKSDKFRNSQFLHLMRQLRDREVRVQGDEMVATSTAPDASSAKTSLNDASIDTTTTVPRRFDNSEQTPYPLPSGPLTGEQLGQAVDHSPPDYGIGIPATEQDHDAGRVDPRDGQEVVDLLNQSAGGESAADIGASTSSFTPSFPEGVFYGDLRQWSASQRGVPVQPTIDWKRWELQSPGYRSHRSAQPAPTLH